jgi:hypothetical protein|tara:strand:- start:8 stop:520 length:513 start_codon:yes stop_codon:yes gene_type:complete
MSYIYCTQKLAKEMGIKLSPSTRQQVGLGNWYANLLRVDRRKCVLFTHEQTLYSLFVANLKKPAIQRLDEIFVEALSDQLKQEKFSLNLIEEILEEYEGKIEYAKTESRSLLGSMNDFAHLIKAEVNFHKSLENVDPDILGKRLNRTPFSAINFEYPQTLFRSRIEQRLN